MQAGTTVRTLLGRRDLVRLLATRLAAQFGDGVFQAALAGTVLFDPERAADPLGVAAGFALLLLPYSLLGPFAGVWLDRWDRRRVLVRADVARAVLVTVVAVLVGTGAGEVPVFLAGLAVLAVTRFVLAALSAALPHTTDEPSLVPANALSTTSGAVATVVGGGAALLLSHLVGRDDAGYAVLALCAAGPYLLAATVVSRFRPRSLGPDSRTRAAALPARDVVVGMVAGARHAWARPPARTALAVITLHRLWFGLLTLLTLLLYRGTAISPSGPLRGGVSGLAEVLAAGALGTLLAAVVTPRAARALGTRRWTVVVLAVGGVAELALGAPFLPATVLAAGLVLGFVSQAVKICVDSTVQRTVEDGFRGRVFAGYDMLFNVAYVVALVLGAVLLPPSGRSLAVLVVACAGQLLTAALCSLGGVPRARFSAHRHSAQATRRAISRPQPNGSARRRRTG